MAILAKKIYMKNAAGIQQTAQIYSTTGEVGSNYMNVNVDGTNGYIPLVSTSDSQATSGRVTKSGTTYAIAATGTPPYSRTSITAAGAGTFTVPSGITKLRVTCVGGGAGGNGTNLAYYSRSAYTNSGGYCYYSGNVGIATTFGSVSAGGGTLQKLGYKKATGESFSSVVLNGYVLSYGFNNGRYATNTSGYVYGGSAVPLVDINGTTVFSAGGGGGVSATTKDQYCLSGASGYRTVGTITVSPGQVISYSVGRGGYAVEDGDTSTTSVSGTSAGGTGGILVEYGQGIQ